MSTFGEKEGAGHGSDRYENMVTVALPFCSFLIAGIVEATCWAEEADRRGGSIPMLKNCGLLLAKTLGGLVEVLVIIRFAFGFRF